jgi:predicted ArsR family transcriptional regulator
MTAAQARVAILGAVQAGAVGTFEAIAERAGVPAPLALGVMHDLRYRGRVAVVARSRNPAGHGRPRAVYALQGADALAPVDVLAFARNCWR